MAALELLDRLTVNPEIYGGKPIIRGRRLAVEHVLGMMSAGSSGQELLQHYDWLEADDIRACLVYALLLVEKRRVPALRIAVNWRRPRREEPDATALS